MHRWIALVILSAAATPLRGQALPDHSTFDRVLKQVRHGGLVDYAGLEADRSGLDAYVDELGRTDPEAISTGSRDAQLAFWINAYNACTLRLVIDHYPIEKRGLIAGIVNTVAGVPDNSIRQIPNTWKEQFCPVAGTDRALDEIEHEIIRPMGDPRIHFAVNCASRSCPVLAPQAYKADSLDQQLDAAVYRFVSDSRHFRLDRTASAVLHVNKVLDWYKDDFGGERGVVEFLIEYVPEEDAAFLHEHPDIRVDYFDYDWTLNDTAVFGSG
jgi:hypothetical protein